MRRQALLFTLAALSLSACGDKAKEADAHGAAVDAHGAPAALHAGTAEAKITSWSYEGDEGPAHWGQLGGANAICSTGQRQSPINLSGMASAKTLNLTLDYTSSAAKIQNTGKAIAVRPTDGGGVVLDGVVYKLQQFLFHTPSEHTIDGHRAAIEAQFVHKNAAGDVLIVAVLSDIGVADPMLAPIWTYLPTDPGPAAIIPDVLINARDLMPATEEFYAYSGSLTTPPCAEGVTWMVYASPLSISPEQIDAYQRLVGSNARPVQATKERDILHIIGG